MESKEKLSKELLEKLEKVKNKHENLNTELKSLKKEISDISKLIIKISPNAKSQKTKTSALTFEQKRNNESIKQGIDPDRIQHAVNIRDEIQDICRNYRKDSKFGKKQIDESKIKTAFEKAFNTFNDNQILRIFLNLIEIRELGRIQWLFGNEYDAKSKCISIITKAKPKLSKAKMILVGNIIGINFDSKAKVDEIKDRLISSIDDYAFVGDRERSAKMLF